MAKLKVFLDKVFDICKQQDCLSPNCSNPLNNNYLISPARSNVLLDISFTTSTGDSIIIKPNEVIYIPFPYKYVKYISNEQTNTIISSHIAPSNFNKYKYDLYVEYKIEYNLEFFDELNNPIPFYILQDNTSTISYTLQAYSIYKKHVCLCGGNVNNLVIDYDSDYDNCYCSELPSYHIKALSSLIDLSLIPINCLTCNPYINQNNISLDPLGVYVISSTIGLFTTLYTYRKSLVEIDGDDLVKIKNCNECNHCEDFYSQQFPYNYFSPYK